MMEFLKWYGWGFLVAVCCILVLLIIWSLAWPKD
jgi:hypothetical protein